MRSRKSYLEKYFNSIKDTDKTNYKEAFYGKISKEGSITNVYSLINLKNEETLPKMDENAQAAIGPVYHMFTTEYTNIDKTLDINLVKSSKDVEKFDKNYGMKMDLVKKIADVIKPDELEIRTCNREFQGPVIYFRNSKTQEDAYLLPTMIY